MAENKLKYYNQNIEKINNLCSKYFNLSKNAKLGGKKLKKDYKKKSDTPLISVITVVYNGEEFIEQAIESVVNQTYENIEYIVIDGNSTDNTLNIIKKFENNISLWISEPDKGIYDAMNKGISVITGDLVYFLNADDTFFSDKVVEEIVKVYQKNQAAKLIYGDMIFLENNSQEKLEWKKQYFLKDIRRGKCFSHQAMFIESNFQKKHLFDLKYRVVADFDVMCKIFKKYPEAIIKVPFKVCTFREGGESSRSFIFNKEMMQIIKNHFGIIYKLKFMPRYFFRLCKNGMVFILKKIGLIKYYQKLKRILYKNIHK